MVYGERRVEARRAVDRRFVRVIEHATAGVGVAVITQYVALALALPVAVSVLLR